VNTFVEFDKGINTAIKKIRQALGDSAIDPRFIETLPRKGYRFIAPVSSEKDEPSGPVQPAKIPHHRLWFSVL
jgi:cholera toxin transcriptional activator